MSTSSQPYFRLLLEMQINDWLALGYYQEDWQRELMEGYVTSADTGAEDLVRASRAALAQFCEAGNTELVYKTLILILSKNVGSVNNNDRVIVPCLEVISFLFDARILQKTLPEYNYPSPSLILHLLTFFQLGRPFHLRSKSTLQDRQRQEARSEHQSLRRSLRSLSTSSWQADDHDSPPIPKDSQLGSRGIVGHQGRWKGYELGHCKARRHGELNEENGTSGSEDDG